MLNLEYVFIGFPDFRFFTAAGAILHVQLILSINLIMEMQVGGQRSEDRGQRSEIGDRKAAGASLRAKLGEPDDGTSGDKNDLTVLLFQFHKN
jgi:hypothetical protein